MENVQKIKTIKKAFIYKKLKSVKDVFTSMLD